MIRRLVKPTDPDQLTRQKNFEPQRWPVGNPEYGYLNCDGSPTKTFLTELSQSDPQYHFFELSFGKRPVEELYDMKNDPDCVNNLAAMPQHAKLKNRLLKQMTEELTAQGDPRILGKGEIFDYYPNCRIDRQQKLYKQPDFDPVKTFNSKFGRDAPAGDGVAK